MRRCIPAILCVLVAAAIDPTGSPVAAEDAADPRFSDAAIAEAARRRAAIEAELAAMDGPHPWAGVYHRNQGQGRLLIAPQAGFVYTWSSDFTLDRNYGSVRPIGERILALDLELPHNGEGVQLPRQLHLVPWDERLYALGLEEIDRFLQAINERHEPHTAGTRHLRRISDDGDGAARGNPELPPAFANRLAEPAIIARVIDANEPAYSAEEGFGAFYTPVTLDAGAADGVREGMRFFRHPLAGPPLAVSDMHHTFAEVTDVDRHQSRAVLRQYARHKTPPPQPDWQLSTLPRYDPDE